MRLTEKSRIAIIGAGPAGSHLAFNLSKAGFDRVILLDPLAPWAKPCAGGLPGRTLKTFPFLEGSGLDYSLVRTINYFGPAGKKVRFELPSPQRNYLRFDLNRFFLERAVGAGVPHLKERVTDITGGSGRWKIEHGGGAVEADYVVGADGVFGITRRKVHSPFRKISLSVSVDAIVPANGGSDVGGIEEIDLVFFQAINGYAWRFPLPGRNSVGFCTTSGLMPGKKMRSLLAEISWENFGIDLGNAKLSGYAIPSPGRGELRDWQVAGPGWALVGDASGAVNPTTREGLFFAFQTARILGESIIESGNPLEYQERWKQTPGRELSASAFAARFLFTSGPQKLILSAGRRSSSMKELLAGLISGEQEYRTFKKALTSRSGRILFELAASLLPAGLQRQRD